MISILKGIYGHKLAVFIAVLSLMWSAMDFNSRFNFVEENQTTALSTSSFQTFDSITVKGEIKRKLELLLQPYKAQQQTVEVKPAGMSDEEQKQQTGELQSLFVHNNKITLKAIIQENNLIGSGKLSALLLIDNVDTNESKIEKFNHNDDVYGFQLSIDTNTHVTLIRANTAQEVILRMYSPKV